MGTSSPFGGAGRGSPLIPTWLDGQGTPPPGGTPAAPANGPAAPGPAVPGDGSAPSSPPAFPTPPADRPPMSKPQDDNRFSGARTSFTRFSGSGGTDRRGLGRAVSRYVSRTAGGPANATKRMGASRTSAASLFSFLSDVQNRGAEQALRSLNLQGLVGRPFQEIFLELLDFICPDEGGSLDEAIAREAFIETIVDVAEMGVTDLEGLSADQLKTVFELYLTNTIEARLCNDIALRMVQVPTNVDAARNIQDQLHDFVQRGVADALATVSFPGQGPTQSQAVSVVTTIYESAFTVLTAMGEQEANS